MKFGGKKERICISNFVNVVNSIANGVYFEFGVSYCSTVRLIYEIIKFLSIKKYYKIAKDSIYAYLRPQPNKSITSQIIIIIIIIIISEY